jgi:hypothetical protein
VRGHEAARVVSKRKHWGDRPPKEERQKSQRFPRITSVYILGWRGRDRTCDTRINSPLLYLLSYTPRRPRLARHDPPQFSGVRAEAIAISHKAFVEGDHSLSTRRFGIFRRLQVSHECNDLCLGHGTLLRGRDRGLETGLDISGNRWKASCHHLGTSRGRAACQCRRRQDTQHHRQGDPAHSA